MYVTILLM